jgi:hypothetical protein
MPGLVMPMRWICSPAVTSGIGDPAVLNRFRGLPVRGRGLGVIAELLGHPLGAPLLAQLGTAGPGRPAWAALMARKRRKTLIVCRPCLYLGCRYQEPRQAVQFAEHRRPKTSAT